MRGNFALMAMLLASGAMAADPRDEPRRRRDDEPDPQPTPNYASPRNVSCPRCKAGAGEDCNRKTLGRRMYHMARVQALGDA